MRIPTWDIARISYGCTRDVRGMCVGYAYGFSRMRVGYAYGYAYKHAYGYRAGIPGCHANPPLCKSARQALEEGTSSWHEAPPRPSRSSQRRRAAPSRVNWLAIKHKRAPDSAGSQAGAAGNGRPCASTRARAGAHANYEPGPLPFSRIIRVRADAGHLSRSPRA